MCLKVLTALEQTLESLCTKFHSTCKMQGDFLRGKCPHRSLVCVKGHVKNPIANGRRISLNGCLTPNRRNLTSELWTSSSRRQNPAFLSPGCTKGLCPGVELREGAPRDCSGWMPLHTRESPRLSPQKLGGKSQVAVLGKRPIGTSNPT